MSLSLVVPLVVVFVSISSSCLCFIVLPLFASFAFSRLRLVFLLSLLPLIYSFFSHFPLCSSMYRFLRPLNRPVSRFYLVDIAIDYEGRSFARLRCHKVSCPLSFCLPYPSLSCLNLSYPAFLELACPVIVLFGSCYLVLFRVLPLPVDEFAFGLSCHCSFCKCTILAARVPETRIFCPLAPRFILRR